MDITKLRPKGPWVLVKVEDPPEKIGSLFVPQGNLEQRVGHSTGVVLRVGDGYPNSKKGIAKTGKKYMPSELKEGDRIIFRGYLQEANRPQEFDKEHCLLHLDDIVGVIPPEAKVEDGSRL